METLKNQELISKYDEALWHGMMDQVNMTTAGELSFIFTDNIAIKE